MLWTGLRKLGKELDFERTDSEAAGMLKNCFVKMYDGKNLKAVELYTPQMEDDDKDYIVKKLEANKIKKHEWQQNGIKIEFAEYFIPYSISKIKDLLNELVNYFAVKYPAQKPPCQHCGLQNKTEIYDLNNVSMLICNDCYKHFEKTIQDENAEREYIPNNYLRGFIGALLFAIPGILLAVLLFVFLNSLAAVSAIAYIFLGILGYKKFKGKITPVGAIIIIIAGLIMVGIGTTVAYSVYILQLLYKEIGFIYIDRLFEVLKMPEIQKELMTNIVISYLVSGIFFALQLNNMLKEWKGVKSIKSLRKIN